MHSGPQSGPQSSPLPTPPSPPSRLRRSFGSIRARLLLSLFVALAAAAVLVGGISYRNVLHETEALFDYQLRQMALSLRDQGEIAPNDAAALNDEDLDFVVQIWRNW